MMTPVEGFLFTIMATPIIVAKIAVVGICIAFAYYVMLLIFGIDYQLKGGSLPLWAYIIKAHKQVKAKVNKHFGIK